MQYHPIQHCLPFLIFDLRKQLPLLLIMFLVYRLNLTACLFVFQSEFLYEFPHILNFFLQILVVFFDHDHFLLLFEATLKQFLLSLLLLLEFELKFTVGLHLRLLGLHVLQVGHVSQALLKLPNLVLQIVLQTILLLIFEILLDIIKGIGITRLEGL